MRRIPWLAAFAAWWVLLTPNAQAQGPNLVEIGMQYMPRVRLEDTTARAQVSSYDAALNVPIPLGKKTFLIPGASYHVDAVSYSNTPPELVQLRAFHSVDLTVLFVQLLPRQWALSIRIAPGLAGDFQQNVDFGLFRFNSFAMATHTFSDKFVFGAGIITTFGFGSFLPLPAVYLEWKPHKSVALEAFLPAFFTFKYRRWGRIELGLRIEFSGNEYAVRDRDVRSRWPCQAETDGELRPAQPDECLDHVAYSVGSGGLTLGVRLFGTIWLSVYGAHSFFRRYDLMNAKDKLLTGGRSHIPNVLMVRANLEWRVPGT